jgi:UDP-N-acetylmuramoyl-tripeptide--D-alanyl-D-alanine ligase
MKESDNRLLKELAGKMTSMEIKGVSIDSRTIQAGELFVAITGDRFDGHDFVPAVMQKGAWGALVRRTALENKFSGLDKLKNILPVDDTLAALQEMAFMHRRNFAIPVVGVTGSNGKTTTKEMLAGILKQKGPVLKNEGNLNNHIGVPLTLLKLHADHRAAVVEMGMSATGEISALARLIGPDVGVITNVGPAHLEFLKTMDRVALAKGELFDHLRSDGTAVLNADDRYFALLKEKFGGRVLSFGIDKRSDVRASDIRQERDFTVFTIGFDGASVNVRLRAVGKHNIYNALAAAAAALAVGMSLDAVKDGLNEFLPLAMRSELMQVRGRTVFADCYNANPASVEAALATLISLRSGGKAIAVLGDMLELGEAAVDAHRAIGATAARIGVDVVITLGPLARQVGEGAIDAGMPKDRVREAGSQAEAAAMLQKLSAPGDAVLIKGSRGMKMEKILEEF